MHLRRAFRIGRNGAQQTRDIFSLLVSDLISRFLALRIDEIMAFLQRIGVPGVSRKVIKGHIFLLEKLQLVKKVLYRSSEYYVSTAGRDFIEFNLHRASADLRDKARFKFLISDRLMRSDPSRIAAIRRVVNL